MGLPLPIASRCLFRGCDLICKILREQSPDSLLLCSHGPLQRGFWLLRELLHLGLRLPSEGLLRAEELASRLFLFFSYLIRCSFLAHLTCLFVKFACRQSCQSTCLRPARVASISMLVLGGSSLRLVLWNPAHSSFAFRSHSVCNQGRPASANTARRPHTAIFLLGPDNVDMLRHALPLCHVMFLFLLAVACCVVSVVSFLVATGVLTSVSLFQRYAWFQLDRLVLGVWSLPHAPQCTHTAI